MGYLSLGRPSKEKHSDKGSRKTGNGSVEKEEKRVAKKYDEKKDDTRGARPFKSRLFHALLSHKEKQMMEALIEKSDITFDKVKKSWRIRFLSTLHFSDKRPSLLFM